MLHKAQALGLVFDPAIVAQNQTLPATDALDNIRESWAPVDGPPNHRPIDPKSSLSNSVAVRLQYAEGDYAPSNVTLNSDGAPADSYTIVPTVDENAFQST